MEGFFFVSVKQEASGGDSGEGREFHPGTYKKEKEKKHGKQ